MKKHLKRLFCRDCEDYTIHEYIGKSRFAVLESRRHYYKCRVCGLEREE